MSLSGSRTYVGFGFGAIQAGLFLHEAYHSNNFQRLVVAEVVPDVVAELRGAGGFYSVNIAHTNRIETTKIGPVEVLDPGVSSDRHRLIEAIADAHEIATAIPRTDLYRTQGPASLHRVLAAGLARKLEQEGPAAVVYAAENHNAAAEILEKLVLEELPVGLHKRLGASVQFLNTVIGKMSGLVARPDESGLKTVVPGSTRAFLVEAFNRILISKIRLEPAFERGIRTFQEKDDLLPFEEAKLFGHNATHALGAYLGMQLGIRHMTDLRTAPGVVEFLRNAFVLESGQSLIRKHAGVDPLFTPEGYAHYADDLLVRMLNPHLMDTAERVARDTRRKLGWDDRLIGTLRLALSMDVTPRRYAVGAAAALDSLHKGFIEEDRPAAELLLPLWTSQCPDTRELDDVLKQVEKGRAFLRDWRRSGYPDPEQCLAAQ